MTTEGSFSHSQAPANLPCAMPDKSTPCLPIPLLENPSNMNLPFTPRVFQMISSAQFSQTNTTVTTAFIHFLNETRRFITEFRSVKHRSDKTPALQLYRTHKYTLLTKYRGFTVKPGVTHSDRLALRGHTAIVYF
jgi:hypothetical protein